MLFFVLFLLALLSARPFHSYSEWRTWVARPLVTAALSVFFVALLSHMWVGLRDVLLDYARPAALRHGLLVLVGVGLLGTAAWVLLILVRAQV
jgi:succinate dehydrogenase / fumarate reductase membrane anchor subunit